MTRDHFNCKWVKPVTGHDAITLFGHTFYYNKVASNRLKRHEDCHKRQQAEEPVMFYPKFAWFCWSLGRTVYSWKQWQWHFIRYFKTRWNDGYLLNPYEIEARDAEGA